MSVSVSGAYKTAVQATSRNMQNLSVTVGGNTYSRGNVRGLTLHECVSENQDRLLPGCAACASIETTVVASLSASLVGTEMTARSGVVLADGSIEYVPLGVFVVQDVHHEPGTNVSTIVGYDRMCLLDGKDFVHRVDEPTEDQSNVYVTFMSLLDAIVPFDNSGTVQWASVPSVSDEFTALRPLDELHGYNCKELIAYIAGAHGKFARFTRNGLLEFAWYSHNGTTIPASATYMGGLELRSESDVSDSVVIYSTNELETTGYSGDYTNDLIRPEFAATRAAVSSTSSPGNLTYRGDPSIQAGDIVTVTTRSGATRRFSVSEHTLTFSGGLEGVIESHGLERQVFHKLRAVEREIVRLKKVYTVADDTTEEVS